MNRTVRYSALIILSLFTPLQSEAFFLKTINTWLFSPKQTTLTKEISCTNQTTLIVENQTGSINIKTWSLPKIVIQAFIPQEKEFSQNQIITDEQNKTIIVKTLDENLKPSQKVNYQLIIPTEINLKIALKIGSIKIKNVEGTIESKVESGSIEITDAKNDLFLKNNNGTIYASLKTLPTTAHLQIESYGTITLALPPDAQATIEAKAPYGNITSELYLTLLPFTTKLNTQAWSRFKKDVNAQLGMGSSKVELLAKNGTIKIIES